MKEHEGYYCANCSFCHVLKSAEDDGTYRLRVRCLKGMWHKPGGEEKLHKFFTVSKRVQKGCPHYTPLGDELPYIKQLKFDLPVKDEILEE